MTAIATQTARDRGSAREPQATGHSAKPDAQADHPEQRASSPGRLFEPGGVTLEDVVLGAWEELVAEGDAECPVCGGRISMLDGCRECGSDLS